MKVFGPRHREDMIEVDLRVKKAMNSDPPGINGYHKAVMFF